MTYGGPKLVQLADSLSKKIVWDRWDLKAQSQAVVEAPELE